MSSDTRNTKVVIFLIAAMTIGAFVLLGLERFSPRTPGWSPELLLMARQGPSVNRILVDYTFPGYGPNPVEYDCVIQRDGRHEWHDADRGREIGIILIGSSADEVLPEAQALKLLAVLGSLEQVRDLDTISVELHPDIDPTQVSAVPGAVVSLHQLLVRKGIIQ